MLRTLWRRTKLDALLPLRTDAWERHLAALDPRTDYVAIVDTLANHVFPLEILLSLELAQLRTFTIPSISRLLHATGEYERHGQKRLDDTRAILTELHDPGVDTPAGQEMAAHLNRIHGLYDISNDDYLYTLSTFVFDPALFVDRWSRRRMTDRERDAFFYFYLRMGEAMHLRELPATREEFFTWRRRYEARHQRYAPENEKVARGLLSAAAAQLPSPLAPLLEPLSVVLFDDPEVCRVLGLRTRSPTLKRSVRAMVRGWQALDRRANPYERARFLESEFFHRYPSYPEGYERMRLGPARALAMLDKFSRGARSA